MDLKVRAAIKEFEQPITVITHPDSELEGGRYDKGDPVEKTVQAVVQPLSREEIEEYEGGNYTTQDIKVFIRAGYEVQENDVIKHGGSRYEVREVENWLHVSDFCKLVAKKEVVT